MYSGFTNSLCEESIGSYYWRNILLLTISLNWHQLLLLPVAFEWYLRPDKISSKEETDTKTEINTRAFLSKAKVPTYGRASLGEMDCREGTTCVDPLTEPPPPTSWPARRHNSQRSTRSTSARGHSGAWSNRCRNLQSLCKHTPPRFDLLRKHIIQ